MYEVNVALPSGFLYLHTDTRTHTRDEAKLRPPHAIFTSRHIGLGTKSFPSLFLRSVPSFGELYANADWREMGVSARGAKYSCSGFTSQGG